MGHILICPTIYQFRSQNDHFCRQDLVNCSSLSLVHCCWSPGMVLSASTTRSELDRGSMDRCSSG